MRFAALIALLAIGCHEPIAEAPASQVPAPKPLQETPASHVALSYVADLDMARGLEVEGHAFGGISGLAYLPGGPLIALSDAHLARGPSRMFRVDISVAPLSLTPRAAVLLGGPFASSFEDPEAIARLPSGELLIASEGDLKKDPKLWPSVQRMTVQGAHVSALPLPDAYVKRAKFNKAFEGFTVAPSGRRAVLTTEHPFEGDDAHEMLLFDEQLRVDGRLRYRIDPLPADSRPGEVTASTIGISELCLIDDDRLLVLERAGVAVEGVFVNHVRIYLVRLSQPAAPKKLAADLDSFTTRMTTKSLDNFEAMTLGPTLPDGRRSLLLASDDNFKATQRTVFLLLAIDER